MSGDFGVKIKDIVSEGIGSSFVRGLLPQKISSTMQTLKTAERPLGAKERIEMTPEYLELAKQAHQEYGDNPESSLPGVLGWLTTQQQKALIDAKEKELRRKERQQTQTKQTRGKQRLARDVFGEPAQPAPTRSAPTRPTVQSAPPPQVKVPSGQLVTKYGGSWYDEQGRAITLPGDIEQLERMARGPAGQSQMATTKNIPVVLPGSKGKRK